MRCPFCDCEETRVIDSRDTIESATRRRRECITCSKRFTTYERVELAPLVVVKKGGTREPFDHEKILRGVIRACEKRPVSRAAIDALVQQVEVKIREIGSEVSSTKIGEVVMLALKKLDKVAYIRFASVYMEFADLGVFEKEVKKLLRH